MIVVSEDFKYHTELELKIKATKANSSKCNSPTKNWPKEEAD